MALLKNFFDKFMHQSLRVQFLLVLAALLVIPVLAMSYDIFFASKSDEIMILDHQEKLCSIVETTIVPGIQGAMEKRLRENGKAVIDSATWELYLRESFKEVAEPLVASFPGVRFGLYLPDSKHIYVHGFLHQYRYLSPDETLERERRILNEADSGLIAVVASRRPLARLTSSLKDETFEYLTPVLINGDLKAVVWADERLHPIFAQSRSFRTVSRYIILLVILIGAAGALLVIHNLTSSVSSIKKGLKDMEKDLSKLLPELPGETGQMAQAINKMAVSLAEKERLELEMQRSERLASLGRLVTGVAHELRNPIGVVKATVQVMENEYGDIRGIDEFTRVIKEQVDRQNRVIQELLDFGRPSKQMVQPVDINAVLEKVLTFTSPLLRENNIDLEVSLTPELPRVTADASRIKQVFVNMILNAIQAMPEEGRLRITTSRHNDYICTEFCDNGMGIEQEQLPRIFDPFFTTKEYGIGLGLSISYQIVKSHQGTIHVTSTPGEGTVFKVKLPLITEQGGLDDDTQDIDN